MATIQGPSLNRAVYQGSHGNLSVAYGQFNFANTPVNTVVEMITMPPGVRMSTLLLYSASGLGEGAGVDVLINNEEVASVNDFSAPFTHTRGAPMHLSEARQVVGVRVKGASASGDVLLGIFYVSEGTL